MTAGITTLGDCRPMGSPCQPSNRYVKLTAAMHD